MPQKPHRPEQPDQKSKLERELNRIREKSVRLMSEIDRLDAESKKVAEQLRKLEE